MCREGMVEAWSGWAQGLWALKESFVSFGSGMLAVVVARGRESAAGRRRPGKTRPARTAAGSSCCCHCHLVVVVIHLCWTSGRSSREGQRRLPEQMDSAMQTSEMVQAG